MNDDKSISLSALESMSHRTLGHLPDNPDTTCPYCGESAPLVDRVQRCVGCGAVIHLDLDEWPNEAKKLAHIRWRVAKQEVALLEKEYGFGQDKAKGAGRRHLIGYEAHHNDPTVLIGVHPTVNIK